MDESRSGRYAAALWRLVHRDGESRWWLIPGLLGYAGLLAAVGALATREFTTSWQPLIVLAAFAHQLMWGAPIAVVAFVVVRRWRATGIAVLALALAVATQAALYSPFSPSTAGNPIVVLQANLRVGQANPAALVRTVEREHVAIATTEEMPSDEQARLVAAGLASLLPYRVDAPQDGADNGLAIWSRYPLTDEVNYAGFQLGVLSAELEMPGTVAMTVLAVHLLPPYPYPAGEWSAEISRLRPVLAAAHAAGPVLVAGDFNATTDQGQYRHLLENGFVDAADQVGAGYLPTYPTDRWFPPLIAIDHVLGSGLTFLSLHSVALPGSDHRGLVASFAL
jgi:endonuclease/exonuclease/phosphatase (EEP) superfamily protein YafD